MILFTEHRFFDIDFVLRKRFSFRIRHTRKKRPIGNGANGRLQKLGDEEFGPATSVAAGQLALHFDRAIKEILDLGARFARFVHETHQFLAA